MPSIQLNHVGSCYPGYRRAADMSDGRSARCVRSVRNPFISQQCIRCTYTDPRAMDIEQFRKQGYAAVDAICAYYEGLASRPVKSEVEPGYLVEALPQTAPVRGEAFETIAADFQSLILPGESQINGWADGRYHPLAAWPVLRVLPRNQHVRKHAWRAVRRHVSNPGFNVGRPAGQWERASSY